MTWEFVLYEKIDGVARITMNRPEARNAQCFTMLRELDEAFKQAAEDDEARVIILAGAGPSFSSGHDLGTERGNQDRAKYITPPGAEGVMKREEDLYFDLTLRLRDNPKPTIAQVQGYASTAGYMLASACDLVIAADDAKFGDLAVRWAAPGVECLMEPWDFGARKAKELLFTGDYMDAQEAWRLGFVNRVVPREKLEEETLGLAQRIALQNPFMLKLAKRVVNEALDIMGQRQALRSAFYAHQLAHAHFREVGEAVVPQGKSVREFLQARDEKFARQE